MRKIKQTEHARRNTNVEQLFSWRCLSGLAQAEVSFQWLTAQARHIFEHLSLKLQELIRKRTGIALQDQKTWTLKVPN